MQFAQLGSTGLIVSRLALGTMTFGSGFAAVQKVDQATADALVGRALDAGVIFFDSADQYSGGQAEEMLGHALGARRHDVVLATKGGLRVGPGVLAAGLSARHLVRAGKVRYVGFCNLPAWQAALMLGLQRERHYAAFVSAQLYYSLVGRDIEHELAPLARQAGLALLPWSPLAGGFLSGKYSRANRDASGDRRATFEFPPVDLDLGYRVLDQLEAIAVAHDASVAQVALAWLLARLFVTSVLIGATRLEQLEANLGAARLRLTPAEIEALDLLTAPRAQYPNWMIERFPDETVQQALRGS